MARGSVGTNTSSVIHIKKAKQVKCDCQRCRHVSEQLERFTAPTTTCFLRIEKRVLDIGV